MGLFVFNDEHNSYLGYLVEPSTIFLWVIGTTFAWSIKYVTWIERWVICGHNQRLGIASKSSSEDWTDRAEVHSRQTSHDASTTGTNNPPFSYFLSMMCFVDDPFVVSKTKLINMSFASNILHFYGILNWRYNYKIRSTRTIQIIIKMTSRAHKMKRKIITAWNFHPTSLATVSLRRFHRYSSKTTTKNTTHNPSVTLQNCLLATFTCLPLISFHRHSQIHHPKLLWILMTPTYSLAYGRIRIVFIIIAVSKTITFLAIVWGTLRQKTWKVHWSCNNF